MNRKKAGRKVAFENRGRKEIKFVAPEEEVEQPQFSGPEVRPDGRAPRVKANLRREEEREEPEQRTLAPFVEQFFGSPSSPKPFIFTVVPASPTRESPSPLTPRALRPPSPVVSTLY